jgi:hypothetical protein
MPCIFCFAAQLKQQAQQMVSMSASNVKGALDAGLAAWAS